MHFRNGFTSRYLTFDFEILDLTFTTLKNFKLFCLRYEPRMHFGIIDELDLLPGDILQPVQEIEPGWWIGNLLLPAPAKHKKMTCLPPGRSHREVVSGVFPASYVHCFKIKSEKCVYLTSLQSQSS